MKKSPTAAAASRLTAVTPPSLGLQLFTAIEHLRNERVDEAEPALLGILKQAPEHVDALQ